MWLKLWYISGCVYIACAICYYNISSCLLIIALDMTKVDQDHSVGIAGIADETVECVGHPTNATTSSTGSTVAPSNPMMQPYLLILSNNKQILGM